MNKKTSRKALGRGLSNLIPIKGEDSSDNNEIHEVSISSIQTNPFQPRNNFNEEEIKGLAESIKNQGLLQPIILRQKDDCFEIISGERRYRAFQYLKRDSVPSIIKQNISDREMLELALIENIQELNEIEKAIAYQKLLLEYGYTHEQLSEHVGKSRASISNSLRLLNLPEEIQIMVRNNQISMGHARALLSLKGKDISLIAQRIIEEQLSVRDIENLSSSIKKNRKIKQGDNKQKDHNDDPDLNDIINRLQYKFGTSVGIQNGSKKGCVSFIFFGREDLSRLIELLLK